jgi:hypothetical protein
MEKDEIKLGVISWHIPEYITHERSKKWYIVAGVVAFAFLVYSFFSHNFLFAVIVIIAVLLYVLNHGNEPMRVGVSLTDEGVVIGRKFYEYDDLKDFSVLYKPKLGIKNLYFEFKNGLRHRLSIPLEDMDPILVREFLLKYLHEDLERTDMPLSESLTRLFKL